MIRKQMGDLIKARRRRMMITPKMSEGYSKEAVFLLEKASEMGVEQQEARLELYSEVISLCPLSPYAYAKRGEIELNLGLYRKAICDFSEAIKIKPESPSTIWLRAMAKEQEGEYEASLDDLLIYRKMRPTEFKTYEWIGYLYKKMERYDDAVSAYSKIIEINDDNQKIVNRAKLAIDSLKTNSSNSDNIECPDSIDSFEC
jgi:tetratricopeptide (TPR) repeat protein